MAKPKVSGSAEYVPESTQPTTMEEMVAWVEREHRKIQQAISAGKAQRIEFLTDEPEKRFDGLMVGADGLNWNPGQGKGVYVWFDTAWKFMGGGTGDPPPDVDPPPDPDPDPNPPTDVPIVRADFETSPTENGLFSLQAANPDRATIISGGREGSNCVRLRTSGSDTNLNNSGQMERCDLQLSQFNSDGYEGRENWYAHSVMFGSDWQSPIGPNPEGIWEVYNFCGFHHTGSTATGNFRVQINSWAPFPRPAVGPVMTMIGYGGGPPGAGRHETNLLANQPPQKNLWYDFVYHIKWSADPLIGFIEAWLHVEGEAAYTKVYDYEGGTLYTGMGCYWKLANYHVSNGQPSSVMHDRFRRGKSGDSVRIPAYALLP